MLITNSQFTIYPHYTYGTSCDIMIFVLNVMNRRSVCDSNTDVKSP